MSRTPGTNYAYSNYEITVRKPFDARMLVTAYSDLANQATWNYTNASNQTQSVAYNGMLVAVANKSDTTYNGVYMLMDTAQSGLKAPSVAAENWHKLANLDELDTLAARVTELEKGGTSTGITSEELEAAINNLKLELAELYVDKTTYAQDQEAISGQIGSVTEAIAALVGEDSKKTVREIAQEVVAEEVGDVDIAGLSSIVNEHDLAITALQQSAITKDNLVDELSATLTKFDASTYIEDSTEIVTNGRKLEIKEMDISKLSQDPNGITIILNGGNA